MATLKDVAKLACVDVSTVSRALNNSSYVHPDTKEKILKAVEQLSYHPNLLAKGLRQGKRHTIGLVIPSIKLSIFPEIAEGIEIEARKLGYGVMICNTEDDPTQEAEYMNRLCNGFVDGLIVTPTGKNGRLMRDIGTNGISMVQLIRKQEKSISSVVADYYTCAYESVRYLASKGCKHIGLVNGNMKLIPYKERYRGYQKAMEELGLEENVSKSQVPQYDNFLDGLKGAHYLLDKNPDTDGILAALDMQGIGVIRALKERNVLVPGQVKVISLTGHSIGAKLETSMTSMEIPAQEIAQKTIQMVIEAIEAPSQEKMKAQHFVFDTNLVIRETT